MDGDDPRAVLDGLIRDRREDYAGLSRLIGRNPAYLQQYVKRGTPRRLAEADRAVLARYFGVDESVLGAPPRDDPPGLVAVPRFALGASAGPGASGEDRPAGPALAFPPAMLRDLGLSPRAALSLISVVGDSMIPTLADGDEILVDRDDAASALRDGIYVLRLDDALLVKRVALHPGGGVSVRSDNPAHRSWEDVSRADLRIVGRVAWVGRRLR